MFEQRTLVVLPTYNERLNLPSVVTAVREQGRQVLVVDDNSPDGTGDIAEQIASGDPEVQVLHRPHKLGLGSAYVAGFKFGLEHGYDFLVQMDVDGSHRIDYLETLIEAAAATGGLSVGSRYVAGGSIAGWGLHRLALSWGGNRYCRAFLGGQVRDYTSGYRCFPRTAIERIELDEIISNGYAFQIEMVYRCLRLKLPVTEVPIHFEDRIAGKSKVAETEIREAFTLVPRLRWGCLKGESRSAKPAKLL